MDTGLLTIIASIVVNVGLGIGWLIDSMRKGKAEALARVSETRKHEWTDFDRLLNVYKTELDSMTKRMENVESRANAYRLDLTASREEQARMSVKITELTSEVQRLKSRLEIADLNNQLSTVVQQAKDAVGQVKSEAAKDAQALKDEATKEASVVVDEAMRVALQLKDQDPLK